MLSPGLVLALDLISYTGCRSVGLHFDNSDKLSFHLNVFFETAVWAELRTSKFRIFRHKLEIRWGMNLSFLLSLSFWIEPGSSSSLWPIYHVAWFELVLGALKSVGLANTTIKAFWAYSLFLWPRPGSAEPWPFLIKAWDLGLGL